MSPWTVSGSFLRTWGTAGDGSPQDHGLLWRPCAQRLRPIELLMARALGPGVSVRVEFVAAVFSGVGQDPGRPVAGGFLLIRAITRDSPWLPRTRQFAAGAALFVLFATIPSPAATPRYEARIRRTSHGIPHIEARDLPSLGFGEGYAQAEDHLCSIADQIVRVRGERSKYFGPGEKDEHLLSDTGMKALRIVQDAAEDFEGLPADLRAWTEGLAAGYNHYLAGRGKAKTAAWCRNADWVYPITALDLTAYSRMLALRPHTSTHRSSRAPRRPRRDAPLPPLFRCRTPSSGPATDGRSDATSPRAVAAYWSQTHTIHGVGSNRFWEKHLTVPGKLDIYGVGLIGMEGVAIGFNQWIAWTHTVSAGKRVTFYDLRLVPGKPTTYKYDDGEKQMTPRSVTVEVRQAYSTCSTTAGTPRPSKGWTTRRRCRAADS